MSAKKKIILNFTISLFGQIIILFLGLILPRIILMNYGSDTNGFISTITQIFTYVALLEAGISVAARNLLYKPLKENNEDGISYVISAAKKYYKRISIYYLFAVVIISFVIPFLLKTNLNYWTIFIYTIFEGLSSVIIFYFINTWKCFLEAKGENYIVSGINLIFKILCFSLKIVLALNGINIAFIQIGFFIVSIIQILIYWYYMKKKYPWLKYNISDENFKLPNRNSYLLTEIAWTIFSSTDMIVLSIMVSTSMSSVYSVYNMVLVAINSLLSAVYTALNYNLGQSFVKGIDEYKKTHDFFNTMFVSTMTILMCVTYVLFIPFVKLYTDEVKDINYIYEYLPLLLCLVQILSWSRYVAGNLSGLAGYAKQTSYISIIEALINIGCSFVFVIFWGIYGVVLATVISLPLKVIYLNYIAERKIMNRKGVKTLCMLFLNYFIFGITVLLCRLIKISINSYATFIIYGTILFLSYSIIVYLLNFVFVKEEVVIKIRKHKNKELN